MDRSGSDSTSSNEDSSSQGSVLVISDDSSDEEISSNEITSTVEDDVEDATQNSEASNRPQNTNESDHLWHELTYEETERLLSERWQMEKSERVTYYEGMITFYKYRFEIMKRDYFSYRESFVANDRTLTEFEKELFELDAVVRYMEAQLAQELGAT